MNKSESIAKLAAAMSKAQPAVGIALKNAINPHLKNRYADLGAVWDAIKDALGTNELSIVQLPSPSDDGKLHLETMMIHASGEWLSSVMVMPISKQDPQGYGSALTYARRYALAAMMGVTQDDDDGDRAVSWREESAMMPAGDAQITQLIELLQEYGRTWEQLAAVYPSGTPYKGKSIETVSKEDAVTFVKFLRKKIDDAK